MRKLTLALLTVALCTAACFGQLLAQQGAEAAPSSPSQPDPKAKAVYQPSPGEQVFNANCTRCHNAPEQISPRITGTVVRHMRVRASLSAADEKKLLEFLAP